MSDNPPVLFSILHFLSIAVRIGFDPTAYSVNEGDGVVTLEVAVLDGVLETEVVVRISTNNGSATCK
jgi:hypothetical protein